MKNTLKLLVIVALVVTANVMINVTDMRAQAAVLYSQDITLAPGWNIMSTPKVVESHRFSMSESVANFDVYVLNANSTSSWSTMADLGQSEFTPLYGYFINNKSNATATLTLNYKASTTPSQRLFERNFSKSGWYSVGVANEDLSLSSEVYNIDTNNPSQIFNTLIGKVSNYIDLVDPSEYSTSTPGLTTDGIPNEKLMVGLNSHKVGNTWMSVNGNNLNNLTDLRDTKGYVIYLDTSSANYVGYQDDVVKDVVHTPAIIVFESATSSVENILATDTDQIIWTKNFGVGYSAVDFWGGHIKVTGDISSSTLHDYKLYLDNQLIGVSSGTPSLGGTFFVDFINLLNKPLVSPGVHNITLKAKVNNDAGHSFVVSLFDATDIYGTGNGLLFIGHNATDTRPFVSAGEDVISSANTRGVKMMIIRTPAFTPATLTNTTGFVDRTVTPNTSNVKIGSFTLQAGDTESIVVNNISVGLMGTLLNNQRLSNLVVKDSGTVIGNPIGIPTTPNNFTVNLAIPQSSTKVLDVYADIGSASVGETLLTGMQINYRGTLTNVSSLSQIATGSVVTVGLPIITASDVSLTQSSPNTQFVVGGSRMNIATFNVKVANNVGSSVIRELAFNVPTNTISSITINGKTASVAGSMAVLYGLNIPVPAGSEGVNIPIEVTFVCVGGNGCIAPSAHAKVSIAYFTYLSGNNTAIVSGIQATSREMILVGSKPIVTLDSVQKTGLVLGAENKIGEVTIAADAAGGIKVNLIPFSLNTTGIGTPEFTSMRIAEGNVTITGSSCTLSGMCSFGNSPDGYVIPAGTSKTFSLYGTVTGTATASTVVSVSSSVIAPVFTWEDMVGGGIGWLGTPIYNFPTNFYSIRQ